MSKFIGVKNGKIQVISDNPFVNSDLEILELPQQLIDISPEALLNEYFVKNGIIYNKNSKKDIKKIKLAIISNWKMKCGISTYAEKLLNKLLPKVGDFKIFAELNEFPTSQPNITNDFSFDENRIVSCWKRGESLAELAVKIKEYDPDVIWINHEFGLFPVARYFLSLLTQLSNYRVITTVHSTFHHRDKGICEAAMPEIIAHLEGARNILKNEKEISGSVYIVPHGCDPCLNKDKLWNYYRSDLTFMMSGFGFKYKNWEMALETTYLLKQKYPNVFFTGLFSESPFAKSEHQKYYDELMQLISQLNIEDNVSIIRGYQSDTSLDAFLRTNKVAIFPYASIPGHEVQGASGAARLAMSKAIPVVSSSIPHFQDLPTIKANNPQEFAYHIENLCLDYKLTNKQIETQNKFLEENNWDITSNRYIEIFELNKQ